MFRDLQSILFLIFFRKRELSVCGWVGCRDGKDIGSLFPEEQLVWTLRDWEIIAWLNRICPFFGRHWPQLGGTGWFATPDFYLGCLRVNLWSHLLPTEIFLCLLIPMSAWPRWIKPKLKVTVCGQ